MRIRYRAKSEILFNRMADRKIYTISQLAEMSYITRSRVGQTVNGKIDVTITTADAIAKTLKCKTVDIFERVIK